MLLSIRQIRTDKARDIMELLRQVATLKRKIF